MNYEAGYDTAVAAEYFPRSGGAMAGGLGQVAAARTPELVRVNDRLSKAVSLVQELAEQLHSHADRLKGELPTAAEKAAPRPVRSGALGATEDILDSLDDALGRLNDGVTRNTTLA